MFPLSLYHTRCVSLGESPKVKVSSQHTPPEEEIADAAPTSAPFLPISLRPHGRRVGVFGASGAEARAARSASPLGPAAAGQRHLLRPAHRLCLALTAAGVSPLANRLCDGAPVAAPWASGSGYTSPYVMPCGPKRPAIPIVSTPSTTAARRCLSRGPQLRLLLLLRHSRLFVFCNGDFGLRFAA